MIKNVPHAVHARLIYALQNTDAGTELIVGEVSLSALAAAGLAPLRASRGCRS
jgi:hypothetical protein